MMPPNLKVLFLGTGGSTPFSLRKMPCIAIKYENSLILFDFGECCQYSLLESKLHPFRSKLYILLTHFHADHVGGIITFLHTLGLGYGKEKITVVGPTGLYQFLKTIVDLFGIEHVFEKLNIMEINIADGKVDVEVIRTEKFNILAFKTEHGVPSLGYVFRERDIKKFDEQKAIELGIPKSRLRKKLLQGKSITINGRIVLPEDVIKIIPGRKIVYTGDTMPLNKIPEVIHNADLLIHEATYIGKYHQILANERYHSTVENACELARKTKAKRLALVHISPRYAKNTSEIYELARKILEKEDIEIIIPNDGDIIEIT